MVIIKDFHTKGVEVGVLALLGRGLVAGESEQDEESGFCLHSDVFDFLLIELGEPF